MRVGVLNPVEVLLVEDNAGDAVLIRQTLTECPVAVNLHIARDGEQALIMLANPDFKPDLIILDLNIPRIPGNVLLERYQGKDTAIVVFSSSWNDAEIQHALQLGAREFVQKPTDIQAFIDAVIGIIEKWGVHSNGAASGGTSD